MAQFDTIISGGRIIDGTGAASVHADLGIIGGRVAALGDLSAAIASLRIDAKGKVVAPGHINQHAL